MYQALYRKWRPMTFADVVGQPQVTETLRRQVAAGRLSHAYLFTGTRGTGKTTCAKLLAKAANCEHPVDGEPCNECASCRGINDGSLSDVTEIDAASNNGVAAIRALRDETIFSPAEARKRVYIIDECHMLSTGAFNALLKTLEEPPEHVLFILATTELHKVPATILSRCQRFAFRRLTPADISLRLRKIAAAEQIPLSEDAASLLSRLAEGGMRDAISMLDQVAASCGSGTIGEEEVFSALGLAGYSDSLAVARAAQENDVSAALERLGELYENGKDLPAFLSELSRLYRDLLIAETTGNLSLTRGGYRADELRQLHLGSARLLAGLEIISDAQQRMQRSLDRRLDAELCLIRLCDPALGTAVSAGGASADPALAGRIEALERTVRELKRGVRTARESPAQTDPAPTSETPPEPSVKQAPPAPKAAEKETFPVPPAGSLTEEDWTAILRLLNDQLGKSNLLQLKRLPLPGLEGDVLSLRPEEFARQQLSKSELLNAVSAAAGEVLGRPVTARLARTEDEDRMQRLAQKFSKFDNFTIV